MDIQSIFKKLSTGLLCLASFIISSSCGNNVSKTTGRNSGTTNQNNGSANNALAVISGTHPDTAVIGTVRFDETNGRIKMTLDITVAKKANQSVAVHIHEHGDCGDMGKMAHGHWNPTKVNHGKWGTGSFHSGDIGNVSLNANGRGTMQLETNLWSIGGDSTKNILDKAIIVHGGVDDYTTQPTGNAGSRIGCGVISRG